MTIKHPWMKAGKYIVFDENQELAVKAKELLKEYINVETEYCQLFEFTGRRAPLRYYPEGYKHNNGHNWYAEMNTVFGETRFGYGRDDYTIKAFFLCENCETAIRISMGLNCEGVVVPFDWDGLTQKSARNEAGKFIPVIKEQGVIS